MYYGTDRLFSVPLAHSRNLLHICRCVLHPSRIRRYRCILDAWGENQVSSTGSLNLSRGAEPMADKPPRESDDGVRRFLTDFRSHTDRRSFDERRSGERRGSEATVEEERRCPDDRRDTYDRREMLLDRRRGVSESFIQEQVGWIREALLNAETEVACPRCEGDLMLGQAVRHGESFARRVHCTACRHCVVIVDVPEDLGEA